MSRGPWLTEEKRAAVRADLRSGFSMANIARRTQLSYNTVRSIKQEPHAYRTGIHADLPPPLASHEICDEAIWALEDFGYFRRRYMGHLSTPWQVATANTIVELLATPAKEYVVENCPPGVGKTTLLHDIGAWAICRNRRVRGLFGSRTFANASRQLLRLRRTLERTDPVKARHDLVERGLAVDAESALAVDYGRFRPDQGEVWRADNFVVSQLDDSAIEEKEPTWSAYGMDQGILGNRFEMILWDDLVDRRVIRSLENSTALEKLWDEELETRLEPGGLLVLVGQRLAARDLYRYCLEKRAAAEDEEAGAERMYRHIVYPAHNEVRCEGRHGRDEKAWPEGCLLDPYRLPWRELRQIRANSPDRYRVLYQQEDVDPASVLVDPVWVSGGVDREGVDCPGCWDRGRALWELPPGLVAPVIMIATADPSPSRFWALQTWAFHPATEQRFLIDCERKVMDAPDFLDWNYNEGRFTGIMEDWWQRSVGMGLPIRYWVVEDNAAQKFLLQYDHVKRWSALRGVNIIPHNTNRVNKADPKMGVTALAPHWRFGRVRLPGAVPIRTAPMKLVEEVTSWPDGRRDDQVMAQWFMEVALPRLWSPVMEKPPQRWVPSWLREEVAV